MEAKDILTLNLKDKYRMIVISDIHGNLSLLRELLAKIDYCKDDYLFILGDIIEKGKENATTLDYIYELARNENVHVIRGNVDRWCDFLVFHDNIDEIMDYIQNRPINIFTDWAKLEGIDIVNKENYKGITDVVRVKYSRQMAWLKNLPLAIETEEFIFAHAGIENIPDWKQSDYKYVLFCDEFCKWGHQVDKWVVVGHWPAYNYAESGLTCFPFINKRRRSYPSMEVVMSNLEVNSMLLLLIKTKAFPFHINLLMTFQKARYYLM